MSSIFGGITTDQYEAIKNIPDVEIAAPIAMVGMVVNPIPTDELAQLSEDGIYLLEVDTYIDDGFQLQEHRQNTYYFYGPDMPLSQRDPDWQNYPVINWQYPINGWMFWPLMFAGIDPEQEAALVGIDEAMLEGNYLDSDGQYSTPPFLINATPYISITIHAALKSVEIPAELSDLSEIMKQGGTDYLATLPAYNTLVEQEMNSNEAYEKLIEQFNSGDIKLGLGAVSRPGRIQYQEITPTIAFNKPVLQLILPNEVHDVGLPFYRTISRANDESQFREARFTAEGVFNIENIPRPLDINRVPLETYFPPSATLYFDETGQAIEPQPLRTTGHPADYIQSPPLLLTTIEAAQRVCGNDCISAIRVRVGGINELTPAAQRKIETIAGEIARLTGLDVDIMVGSSPTRVLVHVPGVGYVEEQWIQKNITTTYQERVQTGHLLLLGTLLGIGGLFVLDLAWAEVVARRRTIALQKALGWRSATVFRQVLSQILLAGVVATLLGTLVAIGISRLAGLPMPSLSLLLGVPLLVVGLCLAGGAYPAWLAAHIPPIVGLQQGNLRAATAKRAPLPTRS
ncbi:MAG: ABC transporter permease, partial [Chloroflexi bacterium]|nr:ABC transporter permease [Chloroflexota bacterium]